MSGRRLVALPLLLALRPFLPLLLLLLLLLFLPLLHSMHVVRSQSLLRCLSCSKFSLNFLPSISNTTTSSGPGKMNPADGKQSIFTKAAEISDDKKMYKYNGVQYSTIMSPEENVKATHGFQAREDDIMLVAYPKCGEWAVTSDPLPSESGQFVYIYCRHRGGKPLKMTLAHKIQLNHNVFGKRNFMCTLFRFKRKSHLFRIRL